MNAAVQCPVAGPQEWADTVLQARYDHWAGEEASLDTAGPTWLTLDEVLGHQAAVLADLHTHLTADGGTPPDTAASYLAGWFAGAVADLVGFGLATAGAGILVDRASLRLSVHRDGWVDRIRLVDPRAVVPAGHRWDGRPEVVAAGDGPDDHGPMLARIVASLVDCVEPIVDACRALAPVGRVGLWNEVADSLGLAVGDGVGPVPQVRDLLAAAVLAPHAPWRARPTLRIVDDPVVGPVWIRHKGGCCLAYRCRPDDQTSNVDLDDDLRAYLARFPRDPDSPRYCATCKFRDPADSEARQLFWRHREAAASAISTACSGAGES